MLLPFFNDIVGLLGELPDSSAPVVFNVCVTCWTAFMVFYYSGSAHRVPKWQSVSDHLQDQLALHL